MDDFFAGDYSGSPFIWLGPAHLGALVLVALLAIAITQFGDAPAAYKDRLRWGLASGLVINEIAWHAWKAAVGQWTIQTMLPLQLCSVMVWLSAWMLLTRSYALYELVYFLGIGGAIQALVTPDLGPYGFPHFRFIQTISSHGLIIIAALYMSLVERMRPTWASLARVVLWMHAYMAVIFVLNSVIGSNYLMLNGKPGTPSLLDLLPAWPAYIAYMEVIGLLTCLLLFLPFAARSGRASSVG